MSQREQAKNVGIGAQTVHKVFLKNYDRLTQILNASIIHLSKYFVSNNLITADDEEEIYNTTRNKARKFLHKIEASLGTGFVDELYLMLDIMEQHGYSTDKQLAKLLKFQIDEEYKSEQLEAKSKELDDKRQEDINSLTLQLKRESVQNSDLVVQLQKKISEEGIRRKQMDVNLIKEKENNRRLYEQYLKTLNEFQTYSDKQKEHERLVDEQIKDLRAEKTSALEYEAKARKEAVLLEQSLNEEQKRLRMKDLDISDLTEQLKAAELGFKEDDKEWRQDRDALSKEVDSLKEKNESLLKENTILHEEVNDLKSQVGAADLALKQDDKEWREDYDTIRNESKSVKEENDVMKREIESMKQEKDTFAKESDAVKQENEMLKAEMKEKEQDFAAQMEAVLTGHKADVEEHRLDYHHLREKFESLQLEKEKLIKEQLDVALIGRRTSMEEMEALQSSLQNAIAILKIAHEEAEKEVVFLKSHQSSEKASFEEQLRSREEELLAENEAIKRELTEVKSKLLNSSPQESLCNEFENMKLQLVKIKDDKEKACQRYGESLSEKNLLQTELQSFKMQLALQKQLHERDTELLHIKMKNREEELKSTVNELRLKIDLQQGASGMPVRSNYSESKSVVGPAIQGTTHSISFDDTVPKLDHASDRLPADRVMQSYSTTMMYHSQTSEPTQSNNLSCNLLPRATASLNVGGTRSMVKPMPIAIASMPSLQSGNAAVYATKTVCTASGEDTVICKQVTDVSDLSCGQQVITQRIDERYEYATIRAFPQYVNGKINFVGVELDLPNGKSDGSAGGVYHFYCKPNHGSFVPVEKLFKIIRKI